MSETLISLLGGAGIGILIQTVVQHFLSKSAKRSDRRFEEQKEAYAAFLEALRKIQSDADISESEVQLLYWAGRVQLVCSDSVFTLLEQLRTTGRMSRSGQVTVDALILAMRHDLGVVK